MLTGYGMDLSFGIMLIKKRRFEKLAKPVERPVKPFVGYLKKVVRDRSTGIRITLSGMLRKIFAVGIDLGIFFRPQKKHVLKIVGKPFLLFRVIEMSHTH